MILRLYSAFMWALQPVLRSKLLRRGRDEAGYLHAIDERFGYYTQAPSSGVCLGTRGLAG